MARKLKLDQLYRRCDPDRLGFETTEELSPLRSIIGQERAVKALELGLGIRDHRYNVYVAGDAGTGKTSTVRGFLERVSATEPRPPDLCYVYNFEDPYFSVPLALPAGRGTEFCRAMVRLIEMLKYSVPAAFSSKEYQERRQKVDESVVQERAQVFEALEAELSAHGFALQRTPIGIEAIPVRGGHPLTEEEYERLEESERQALEEARRKLQPLLESAIREVTALEDGRLQRLGALHQQMATYLIRPPLARLQEHYADQPAALSYLKAVERDLMENLDQFLPSETDESASAPPGEAPDPFFKYKVNVLVDHSHTEGAPVVVQDNATYTNLFGKIEYRMQMGAMTSDFTLIKPGSLHEANGGYLVLNGDNLMRNPASWEGLKVAFKCGQIAIEDPDSGGVTVASGLRPQPVPFDVKVIVVGSHELYRWLSTQDEDFRKFFNVRSEFANQIDWKAKHVKQFGPFIRTRCQERGLLPFDAGAVARVVEYAGQLVGSQRKLSARFSDIMVIVREADYWARRARAKRVSARHVDRAIDEKHYRANRVEHLIQEMLRREELLVDVEGSAVGQVNGLTVYELGDLAFGQPVRITAAVYAGKDGVVNIEREAELSGKIHTKGLLILKGWLGEHFALDKPLSLTASLTFEQSYSFVDGDSASCAELLALLSALSGVPLKQSMAITGSMNQKGQVQPIGGINQKVEGFYKVCQAKGLSGEQGVILPHQNVDDLMLHHEVVQAVRRGDFHLWTIRTVEEGLALLTGRRVGKPTNGVYPKGSLFGRVDARLRAFSRSVDSHEEGS